VLDDLPGYEAHGVGVEWSGQTPVARDQHDQPLALFAPAQERVLVAAENGCQVGKYLVEQLRVGAGGES
jgi:hypothetical protein